MTNQWRVCRLQLSLCFVSVFSMAAPALADDVDALAAEIDRQVELRRSDAGVAAAPLASDAEFLRRIYLDVGGKIPPVSEVRSFLQNEDSDKRRQIVDRLLESSLYVTNFTSLWRAALIPEANADVQVRFLLPSFEAWLRQKLTDNVAYDELVRDILTTKLTNRQGFRPYQPSAELSPIAFYQAKQIKPENLAAATSRMFLGIRIECAQCHDHPFDKWKREEFWSFAAFYGGIERSGQNNIFSAVVELFDRRELAIPDTDIVVQAAYLDGSDPIWRPGVGARQALAQWMTSAENPYFSKMAANRLWGHFFGRGLVEPVDDFVADNPASHPELLSTMAQEFAAHNFDLKFLIRAITASNAYQLTSRQTADGQDEPELFARMATKGLTPQQLFASLAQATGFYRPYSAQAQFSFGGDAEQMAFFETFNNDSDSQIERQTTILQALTMMNGQFVANATSLNNSQTLAALADYPLMTNADRIEALYLAALGRQPRNQELTRLVRYVEAGGVTGDAKQALSDVFWALLNSSEFMFNH